MLHVLPYFLAAAGGAAIMGLVLFARARAGTAAKRGGAKQNLAELQRFRAAVDTCVDSIYMVDRGDLAVHRCHGERVAPHRLFARRIAAAWGRWILLKESREELIRSYDAAIAAAPTRAFAASPPGDSRMAAKASSN